MKMSGGWTGKILRVDLTNRRSWEIPSEPYTSRFIGGIGIGLKVLWDEVDPGVGAYDPENRLVFATGPLTGTPAPGSGRFEMVSVSPRSYPKETVTRSGMGGFWGPELKFAGYDALIIEGTADRWCYLWISDGCVEIRDAEALMGLDTVDTQIRLRRALDPKARILCIGPAGEHLSRLAAIMSETSFASGRSGFGAVMGAKRLKAVAVRGHRPIQVHDPGRLLKISAAVRHQTADHVNRERGTQILSAKNQEKFVNTYRIKSAGCFGCPVQCFSHLRVPDSGESTAHCISYFYYAHASRYYGDTLERDQAASDGFVLANRYGIDTFEFWHMIHFLKDLHRAGLIDASGGFLAEEIGSRKFIQTLVEAIAFREGIGDLLAEGCVRASERIHGAEKFRGKYFPAYGSAAHGAIRDYPGVALQWALDSRCPVIDQHSYIRLSASYQKEEPPFTLPPSKAGAIAEKVYGTKGAIDHSTFDDKPEAIRWTQDRSTVNNLLVLCDWMYPVLQNFSTPDRMGDTSLESRMLSAATGYELSEAELDGIGARVWHLARAIMVREGRGREQDRLDPVFFKKLDAANPVPEDDFEKAKTCYYQLRGWDDATGHPSVETLTKAGLPDVAERFK
jgi:aldehyde:ferredoxin oxidoreductase